MASQTRMVGPLSMRADVGAVDTAKRTATLTWSTGAKVLRSSWGEGQFYEELAMGKENVRLGRLNNGAPVLKDHRASTDSVLGVVDRAYLEGNKGRAVVRFGKSPAAEEAFQNVKDGILRNVSVGYRILKAEKIEARGEQIPTIRAIDWEPHEISIVAIGADPDAGFRSSASQTQHECVIVTRSNNMSDGIGSEAARLERERVLGIQAAARGVGLGEDFAQNLIENGTSLDEARKLVINEGAARNAEQIQTGRGSVEVGASHEHQRTIELATTALIRRSGKGAEHELCVKRGFKGFEKDPLDGGRFREFTLVDHARDCLRRRGIRPDNMSSREAVARALETRGGMAGTSDFAVLLENVMYKSMRAAYATQPDSWRRWCGVDTVEDFRESNRYVNGSFGDLPVVPEHAEFRNVEVPDGAKISISTETRGAIFSVSRQALQNDDMGALTDLSQRFGRGASRTIESEAYSMLGRNSGLGPTMSDSQPFFHSNRANVATSAVLGVAGIDADRLKMMAQRDHSDNQYLGLVPSILLVPATLEMAAKVLNSSSFNHDSGADSTKPNAAQGIFADVIGTPWLTGTRRYSFTAQKEAFKVVFLDGSGEGPTLESEQSFRTDGLSIRARIDFKLNAYDPKTAVTSAGT